MTYILALPWLDAPPEYWAGMGRWVGRKAHARRYPTIEAARAERPTAQATIENRGYAAGTPTVAILDYRKA